MRQKFMLNFSSKGSYGATDDNINSKVRYQDKVLLACATLQSLFFCKKPGPGQKVSNDLKNDIPFC